MTCEECLEAVSGMSLQESVSDPQIRKHWEECKDCSHVLTVVATAERDFSELLKQQSSVRSPSHTAETAVSRVKRRRLGIVVSAFLVTLLAGTLWIAWVRVVVPAARETVELTSNQHLTETLELKSVTLRRRNSHFALRTGERQPVLSAHRWTAGDHGEGNAGGDEDREIAARPVRCCSGWKLQDRWHAMNLDKHSARATVFETHSSNAEPSTADAG